jgi:uncharacterized membrane protein
VLRLLPAFLTLGAVLWTAALIAAPYALMSAHAPLVSAAAAIYTAASLICHQRAARSFHLGGVQLPVCGRCAALYLSGAFGAVLPWIVSRRPRVPANTRRILLWASIPTALSVVLEWSGLVDPTNVGRAICAVPLGASAAWIFVQSLRAEGERMRYDRVSS